MSTATRRIEPLRTTSRAETAAKPSTKTHWCDECGEPIRDGHVATDHHHWYPDYNMHGISRYRLCEPCHTITMWIEAANASGKPMGVVLSGPSRIRSSRAVDKLIKKYPQLKAIEQ